MSTIKANTLTGTTTAGSIAVTGETSSTTTNLQQGLAKAWLGYASDSSQAITGDTFNISGFTDVGSGQSTHTLTNNMNTGADTYSVQNTAAGQYPYHGKANSSSVIQLRTVNSSGNSSDGAKNATVHGDLA
tara:strand:+ start:2931 stop:3323 length:393 start_codon:yes stop_codon:yes gene_type:complete